MKNNYRFDLIGLSTEDKPTKMEDGTILADGSTFYEVDTSEFYIFYRETWYKQGESSEEPEETENLQTNINNLDRQVLLNNKLNFEETDNKLDFEETDNKLDFDEDENLDLEVEENE